MVSFPCYIAQRYLFSKRTHHVVHWVTLVSVCGVAVSVAALVCVLSVFNGFQEVVQGLFSDFDPQLRITAVEGKVFEPDSIRFVAAMPEVVDFGEVLQEQALAVYKDRQTPVQVKGVPDNYARINRTEDILLDGEYRLQEGNFNLAVCGVGLVHTLGCGVHFVDPVYLYAPKRLGCPNPARPDEAFRRELVWVSGVFMVQQEKYDNSLMLVSLPVARELFDYPTQVSAVELRLAEGVSETDFQQRLQTRLGAAYRVDNRYNQQEEFFRMMEIEKWISYLILSFILLIAVFNIIGSLSMLMIEKQADIAVLQHLGASRKELFRLFLIEGWMVSLLGAAVGLVLGVLLCYMQQQFGWIRMGAAGQYIVDAYPVVLRVGDVVIVGITVAVLGLLASAYPASQVGRRALPC